MCVSACSWCNDLVTTTDRVVSQTWCYIELRFTRKVKSLSCDRNVQLDSLSGSEIIDWNHLLLRPTRQLATIQKVEESVFFIILYHLISVTPQNHQYSTYTAFLQIQNLTNDWNLKGSTPVRSYLSGWTTMEVGKAKLMSSNWVVS